MQSQLPLTRDLVLIGGGHTHALALRMWGMNRLAGCRVTLVNPDPVSLYSGMVPGVVAGTYAREACEIDLVRLSRFAGARFLPVRATGLDTREKLVHLEGRASIRYDVASLDLGIHTAMSEIAGFASDAEPVKPLDRFLDRWESWCRARTGIATADVCVIGAGLAGVELALAAGNRLRGLGVLARVRVLDAGAALSGVAGNTRSLLFEALRKADITLHEHTGVEEVLSDGVRTTDGRTYPSDFTIGAAGARPHAWVGQTGMETFDGHIVVDRFLRSVSSPDVFASGDCAHFGFNPRPKAGVYAVRAAPVLYRNLRGALSGRQMRKFRPQGEYLKLVSLGDGQAVADRSGLSFKGEWVWHWKDHIDRKFMRRFQELPPMPQTKLPREVAQGVGDVLGDAPLCGGCGAKVAGAELKAGLDRIPPPQRKDVLTLPGDDAAILAMGGDWQVITTDHLRAFSNDTAQFARIAIVHALGDIWAMGARPQVALASVTLPRMRGAMQSEVLGEILDAATKVLRAEGADLVGGHTSVGAEMTLGFTLTGLSGPYPITLEGAKPDDVLLLTKPIGSGTVLAAEMQGLARGADVIATLDEMARPQGRAAQRLRTAHAMTDVTGFGLAGHLMEMCLASGCAATLRPEDIPLYPGAEALASRGIRSTLYPGNRATAAAMTLASGPRTDLLFDPQTAGGLLAAVDPKEVDAMLDGLRSDGFRAARIGTIEAGAPHISVL